MKIKLSDDLFIEVDDISNPEPGGDDSTLVRMTRDVGHVRAGETIGVDKPYDEFVAELHVATMATIREQRARLQELERGDLLTQLSRSVRRLQELELSYEDDEADLKAPPPKASA
jgi:hypothetical protein